MNAIASGGPTRASAESFLDRLAPDHRSAIETFDPALFDLRDVAAARRALDAAFAAAAGDGRDLGRRGRPAYASPSLATDLRGLPATHLSVGELDLFRDEVIDYGRRLLDAGAPTDLHVYPGAFHDSDTFVPAAAMTGGWIADRITPHSEKVSADRCRNGSAPGLPGGRRRRPTSDASAASQGG